MNKQTERKIMKKVIAATAIALGMSTTANAVETSRAADGLWALGQMSMVCSATEVVMNDAWFEMVPELRAEIGEDYQPSAHAQKVSKEWVMKAMFSPREYCDGGSWVTAQNALMQYKINQ